MLILTLLVPLLAVFQPSAPKFEARLIAEDELVAPGGSTELIVQLTVEPKYHVYDPIVLDTGTATEIDFELPEGVTVGGLRFPTPELGETAGLRYLAHEGTVNVLTTLHVAEDGPAEPFEVRAKVYALACKELCVPVTAEASLRLNDPDAIQEVEGKEQLFERARGALPPRLEKAEYVAGSEVLAAHTKVPVGGQSELIAIIDVDSGLHIQDRNPPEGFIPTQLFVQSRPGVKFRWDEAVWPKAHVRSFPGLGDIPELSGRFAVRVPFEVEDPEFEPGRVDLKVLFQYQACTDAGQCYAPLLAAGELVFEVVPAGESAVANADPALRDVLTAARGGGDGDGREAVTAGAVRADQRPLWLVLLAAFAGGMILNVMPCVLPVISLKIFGFVQQAGDDRGRILRTGLMYTAGILASFAPIAVIMGFANLAWGGLMQSPAFMIGLSAVVFAFALSLLGVYELNLPGAAASAASAASAKKEGYGGAFLNGVMTTLLATPCVGPFLGSAVGVLSTLEPAVASAGIMTVGLGLAAPYVLLTAFPGWLRFLPKPGTWMVTFKQVVGFILVAVVLWLLSILATMVDLHVLLGTLGLLTVVALGCWVIGKVTLSDSAGRAAAKWGVALVLVAGGGWSSFAVFRPGPTAIPWQEWEPGIAERLAADGYTVYVDYTATWCLTCQSNKKLVLETNRVAREFEKRGIYPIKADFTRQNPVMQEELKRHGRIGVPLNMVVPAGRPEDAIILPEVLTTQFVLDVLEKAGPSRVTPAFWDAEPADGAALGIADAGR